MKEFEVEITETLQRTVVIRAGSRAEAEVLAEELWNNEEFVLGAEDFVGAEFSAVSEKEIAPKYTEHRKAVSIMRFMVKVLLLPLVLVSAFLALMLRWTLNLSAFILALPMMYIFGCGLYTLYCREWTQFLILLAAEFGCFLLITAGTVIVEAVEWFSGWIAEL